MPFSKLPTSLRIGPYRVRVLARSHLEMERDELQGRFHGERSVIHIRDDAEIGNARDTLLHEALHALLYCHGTKAVLDLDDDLEEKFIRGLVPGLLSLLRDNPTLVAYLTA